MRKCETARSCAQCGAQRASSGKSSFYGSQASKPFCSVQVVFLHVLLRLRCRLRLQPEVKNLSPVPRHISTFIESASELCRWSTSSGTYVASASQEIDIFKHTYLSSCKVWYATKCLESDSGSSRRGRIRVCREVHLRRGDQRPSKMTALLLSSCATWSRK